MEIVNAENPSRPKRKWTLWVLGFFSLFFTVAFYFGLLNPLIERWKWFAIQEITTKVAWPITEEVAQTWVRPLKGKNLITLDAKKLIRHLKENSWVYSVALKKEYPNRLHITFTSKTPKVVFLQSGKSQFLDNEGNVIAPTSPGLLTELDLPILRRLKSNRKQEWNLKEGVNLLEKIQTKFEKRYEVSEIILRDYPEYSLFLTVPKVEVLLSLQTWEDQFDNLIFLLGHKPNEINKIHKINLVFPKKAIVS